MRTDRMMIPFPLLYPKAGEELSRARHRRSDGEVAGFPLNKKTHRCPECRCHMHPLIRLRVKIKIEQWRIRLNTWWIQLQLLALLAKIAVYLTCVKALTICIHFGQKFVTWASKQSSTLDFIDSSTQTSFDA